MSDVLQEALDRAKVIYEEKLKAELEPEHNGEIVAINSETGEYCLGTTLVEAWEEFDKKFPGVTPGTLRVGHRAMYRFGVMP